MRVAKGTQQFNFSEMIQKRYLFFIVYVKMRDFLPNNLPEANIRPEKRAPRG